MLHDVFDSLEEAEEGVVGFRSIQDGGRQIQDQGCKTAPESTVNTPKSSDQQSLNMVRCMVDFTSKAEFPHKANIRHPSPRNVHLWYGLEQMLALCTHNPGLQHMLTGCKSTWPGTDGPTTGSYGNWQTFWRPTNLKQMSFLPFIQGSIHLVRQKAEEGKKGPPNHIPTWDHHNLLAARHYLVAHFCDRSMGVRYGGRKNTDIWLGTICGWGLADVFQSGCSFF